MGVWTGLNILIVIILVDVIYFYIPSIQRYGNSLTHTTQRIYIYIHTVKYADDLVLLAKEEKVPQDIIDKLNEIGRCYEMEMNVEKTKVMRISRQPLPVKIMIDQKQLENVESLFG